MRYAILFLLLSACTSHCKTNTVRCKDRKAQVCIDDTWYTARECKDACYVKEDMPYCTEDVK